MTTTCVRVSHRRAARVLGGAVAALLPLALTPAAVADTVTTTTSAVQCGSEVRGHVVLTESLSCTGTALVVRGPDVTVDLNGKTIRYVGGPIAEGAPIYGILVESTEGTSDATNTRVHDGKIEGYSTAVRLVATEGSHLEALDLRGLVLSDYGRGLTVRNSRVRGIGFAYQTGVQIEGNHIRGAVGGLAVRARIRNNVIIGSTPHSGVRFSESDDIEVTGNRISGADIGVHMGYSSSRWLVENNEIMNSGVGVLISGASFPRQVTIRANKIRNSGSSAILSQEVQDFETIRIEQNDIAASGFRDVADPSYGPARDGITIIHQPGEKPAGFILGGNRVRASAGHGINAPGVTDAGGNTAKGSRLSPACVGVRCR